MRYEIHNTHSEIWKARSTISQPSLLAYCVCNTTSLHRPIHEMPGGFLSILGISPKLDPHTELPTQIGREVYIKRWCRKISASETQTLYCYWGFDILSSYSTFPPKFALASPPWKQARLTWNFDSMCSTSQFVVGIIFRNLTYVTGGFRSLNVVTTSADTLAIKFCGCMTSHPWAGGMTCDFWRCVPAAPT